MFAETEITCARITVSSELCNGYTTTFSISILVTAHNIHLPPSSLDCIGFASAHTYTRSVFADVPKFQMHDSLSFSSFSPFLYSTCSYAAVCIYASYIITPDGASTSRTLSKASHDSVYLLNTEYNISLAYICTCTCERMYNRARWRKRNLKVHLRRLAWSKCAKLLYTTRHS